MVTLMELVARIATHLDLESVHLLARLVWRKFPAAHLAISRHARVVALKPSVCVAARADPHVLPVLRRHCWSHRPPTSHGVLCSLVAIVDCKACGQLVANHLGRLSCLRRWRWIVLDIHMAAGKIVARVLQQTTSKARLLDDAWPWCRWSGPWPHDVRNVDIAKAVGIDEAFARHHAETAPPYRVVSVDGRVRLRHVGKARVLLVFVA
mmetsp:Transcript_68820/g.136421  ORF Transcript_68820/g.136421 Transcript_68820/m.136421 type:complete len:208 (+) Transcript_68820:408-1031(+)